uniref:Reverse transcriptase domain-containing protein n=1 Tax=Arion vulgaris TaxID=1028688 RepID=A0A0B7BVB2_9EUPU
MQRKTDNLSSIASKVGLQISYEKTNIMKTPMASNADITLESKMIKIAEQFTYLGSNFGCTGDTKTRQHQLLKV